MKQIYGKNSKVIYENGTKEIMFVTAVGEYFVCDVGCDRDDDASPEHASSADVRSPSSTHAGTPRHGRPPSNAAASDAQGEQARNIN